MKKHINKAVNHYTLGVIFQAQVDCITLLCPWWNHYVINVSKKKIDSHFHGCTCPGGGKESISNWHFLMVVPQPVGFCILNKRVNYSIWIIFLCLIRLFPARHFQAKCSFQSSIHSLQSCQSGRLTKGGLQSPVERFRNSYNRLSARNSLTNIHVLWNLHSRYTTIQWCNVCCV